MAMPAMAITEQGNTFSAIKFYRAMQQHGVKPIIGAELNVIADNEQESHSVVLLCQHIEGFKNLSRLISKSYMEGQHRGVPFVRKDWLASLAEGLIALSAAEKGELGHAIANADEVRIETVLEEWCRHFPDRFYIELQRTGQAVQPQYIAQAVNLADKFRIPVVATNNVRFLDKEDFEAHEARICIHDGYTLNDPRRPRRYTEQQYLRSSTDMATVFSDIPEALTNTLKIAQRSMETDERREEHQRPVSFPLREDRGRVLHVHRRRADLQADRPERGQRRLLRLVRAQPAGSPEPDPGRGL